MTISLSRTQCEIRSEMVLRNAQIILADRVINGSILVRNGLIADISEGVSSVGKDMDGDYLLPGLVELHTDHLEGHYSPRPKVRWNPLAAVQAHDAQIAASGITTVFDALRIGHDGECEVGVDDMVILANAINAAQRQGSLRADHWLHLRCEVSSDDCLSAFSKLKHQDRVRIISLMDHAPGQRQFSDMESYRVYFMRKRRSSPLSYEEFCARRVAESERNSSVNRKIISDYSHEHNIVVASHDDATAAHVAEAVAQGIKIAEFPTTIEAAAASHNNGIAVMMGGPNVVRGGSHSGNVSACALAERGVLDIISSDYIPFSMMQAAFHLAQTMESVDLPQAVRMVSLTPASVVGMKDRGQIAVGLRADMVRVRRNIAHSHEQTAFIPIIRSVWREGQRVA